MRCSIEPASKLRAFVFRTPRILLSVPRRKYIVDSVRTGMVAKFPAFRHGISNMSTAKPDTPSEETEALPKLSASEFREYNRLAEHMDQFHTHFRHTWNTLYDACCGNKRPSGVSIRQFMNMAMQFISQLNLHHSIEEQYFFPELARKMPQFKKGVDLLKQHKEIHKGMDRLEEYLEACRTGERELRLSEMKEVMDTFGKVLWDHLDDEVRTLGAENMRKYWTIEEMRQFRM